MVFLGLGLSLLLLADTGFKSAPLTSDSAPITATHKAEKKGPSHQTKKDAAGSALQKNSKGLKRVGF
jgi:hypothetical protein